MLHHVLMNAAQAAAESTMQLSFDPDAFLKSLPLMGKGMLGIFVALVVIMIFVWIMAKIGGGKK